MLFGMKTSGISPFYPQKTLETNGKQFFDNHARKNSFMKQLKAFAEKTSCHGIQRILRDDKEGTPSESQTSHIKSYIWCILTLSSFGMAVYSLSQIAADYSSYPTTTLIERKANGVANFPAVTICNINFAPEERLLKNDAFLNLFERLGYTTKSRNQGLKNMRNAKGHMSRIRSSFGFLSHEEREYCGHQIEEMLLECEFGGRACSAKNFTSVYDYTYGMCYTFNYGFDGNKTKQDIQSVQRFGEKSGLVLTLDVQSDKYLPRTEKAGVRLVLHEPRVTPNLQTRGISVAPGSYTILSLSMTETVEAEPPYGRCVPNNADQLHRNMYSSLGVSYTKDICERSCLQAFIINHCACCDSIYPCNPGKRREMFGASFPRGSMPPCNTSNSIDVQCVSYIRSDVSKKTSCARQCPPRCKTVSYEVENSATLWPHQQFATGVYDDIDGKSRSEIAENKSSPEQQASFVRENVLKLDINFLSHTKIITTTQPAYTWGLLLSNIGGQLGLWLGFSILTAFEILELLLDVGAGGALRTWKKLTTWCLLKRN